MWKNCLRKEEGTPEPQVEYLDEAFYACIMADCHFAVHLDCYGGSDRFKRKLDEDEEEKETEEV